MKGCQRHKHQVKLLNVILTIFLLQGFPNTTYHIQFRSPPHELPTEIKGFFIKALVLEFEVLNLDSGQNCPAWATQHSFKDSSGKTNFTKSKYI